MDLRSKLVTAQTFFKNFSVPCLWIAASAFVLGSGVGGFTSYKITRAVFERATLKAENKTLQLEKSLSDERAENLRLGQELSAAVLENRDEQKHRLDDIAGRVDDLGNRVRLCATKSDVRITVTPEGAIETVPDGQLRDLAEAVREFAQACAAQRDRDANDHNALIDWLEKIQAGKPR